jgi:hypothetical protein
MVPVNESNLVLFGLGLVLIFADSSGAQPADLRLQIDEKATLIASMLRPIRQPTSKHEWQIKDDRDPVDDGS